MTGIILLAVGHWLGLSITQTLLLLMVLIWPVPTGLVVGVVVLYGKFQTGTKDPATAFCVAVSSELRGGSDLRGAIRSAWESNPPPGAGGLVDEVSVGTLARQLGGPTRTSDASWSCRPLQLPKPEVMPRWCSMSWPRLLWRFRRPDPK